MRISLLSSLRTERRKAAKPR